jgi:hypothetical protein
MNGNVVISVVDAVAYVVLSEAKKITCLMGELVGTTECMTLYIGFRTNRGCYNCVQLYLLTCWYYD